MNSEKDEHKNKEYISIRIDEADHRRLKDLSRENRKTEIQTFRDIIRFVTDENINIYATSEYKTPIGKLDQRITGFIKTQEKTLLKPALSKIKVVEKNIENLGARVEHLDEKVENIEQILAETKKNVENIMSTTTEIQRGIVLLIKILNP